VCFHSALARRGQGRQYRRIPTRGTFGGHM